MESVSGPWCLVRHGRAHITRSLTQTRAGLAFKCPKNGKPRKIKIPASAQAALEEHRKRQDVFRAQFGDLYRAGDLIFAHPDGSPLKPDSMSSAVSLLFRRLKLPKGVSLHSLRHTHVRNSWTTACR